MFKRPTNIVVDQEQSNDQKNRLEEILKSIDGLIFSIKMDNYQSVATHRSGNSSKALEYTAQEMMEKKNILFNLLPKDELYAITKKKSANPVVGMPMN